MRDSIASWSFLFVVQFAVMFALLALFQDPESRLGNAFLAIVSVAVAFFATRCFFKDEVEGKR